MENFVKVLIENLKIAQFFILLELNHGMMNILQKYVKKYGLNMLID